MAFLDRFYDILANSKVWLVSKFLPEKKSETYQIQMTFVWPWSTVFLYKCLSPQRWHSIQSTGVRSQFRDFSKIIFFKNHKNIFKVYIILINSSLTKKSYQSSNIRLYHLIGCWRNRTPLVNLIFERKRLKYRPIKCEKVFELNHFRRFNFLSVKWLLRIDSVTLLSWLKTEKKSSPKKWQKVR